MSTSLGAMPVNYYNNDISRSVARNYEDDYFARIRGFELFVDLLLVL